MLKADFQKAKKHDLTCANIETVCGKDFIQLIINEGTSKLLKLVQELFVQPFHHVWTQEEGTGDYEQGGESSPELNFLES